MPQQSTLYRPVKTAGLPAAAPLGADSGESLTFGFDYRPTAGFGPGVRFTGPSAQGFASTGSRYMTIISNAEFVGNIAADGTLGGRSSYNLANLARYHVTGLRSGNLVGAFSSVRGSNIEADIITFDISGSSGTVLSRFRIPLS